MLTEEERTRRMIDLLRPDITQVIKFNEDLLVTVEDCFRRALRVNWRLALIQEKEAKEGKAKDEQAK